MQDWFEMIDIRRRRFSNAVWIPLHLCEHLEREGQFGHEGYRSDFFGVGTVAVPLEKQGEIQRLSWSNVGLINRQQSFAGENYYKPVDVFQLDETIDFGIELCLVQNFSNDRKQEWHLNQDLVFAFGLLREEDSWLIPSENYAVVARLRRDHEGRPIAMEIKNEFLKDYLCARRMGLFVSSYRQRDAVAAHKFDVNWPEENFTETADLSRFHRSIRKIIPGGAPLGGTYSVFEVKRTDIDISEDVPMPGPEQNENIESRNWSGKHEGKLLYHVAGELYRTEWFEPSALSPRIRSDTVPSNIDFIVDASGKRMSSESLDDEDILQWLWFKGEVVNQLGSMRDGKLAWSSAEMGELTFSAGYQVWFGVNSLGHITVYAYDIAKLPLWQMKIWAGFNITPEGGVSSELIKAQMEVVSADTKAPEQMFVEGLDALNLAFLSRSGLNFLRPYHSVDSLLAEIHRFRSLEPNGIFRLAKDITKAFIERIEVQNVRSVIAGAVEPKLGSIKILEKYLSTIVSPNDARAILGPLVGIYELRLADSHLASEDLEETFRLARVDKSADKYTQGLQILHSAVDVVRTLFEVLRKSQ